jgi:hypothetical protein
MTCLAGAKEEKWSTVEAAFFVEHFNILLYRQDWYIIFVK